MASLAEPIKPLKEITTTGKYQFPRGFQTIGEYRRDFSNRLSFLTSTPSVLASSQDIATVALLWSFGGKQGIW
jgi:hypothetical protein